MLLVPLIFLAGCGAERRTEPTAAGPSAEHDDGAWIGDHVVDLRTIDPDDRDFSDLARWGEAVGDAQVVMLGEVTHSEGPVYEAKARLIAYLHEELGFDVLAFESGFYDCHRAQQLIDEGADPITETSRCVHPIWSSREFLPTLEYVAQSSATDRPLTVAGFDSRFTDQGGEEPTHAGRDLVAELDAYLGGRPSAVRADPGQWERVVRLTDLMLNEEYETTPREQERNELLAAAAALEQELDEAARGGDADAALWSQVLRSVQGNATYAWELNAAQLAADPSTAVEALRLRDEQMADNLLWLARERYPDRRIIVWGATAHVARNLDQVEGVALGIPVDALVPMGHLVAEELGTDAVYVLGVATHGGEYLGPTGEPEPIPAPPSGSVEDLLQAAGAPLAILDLRGGAENEPRLREPRASRQFSFMTEQFGEVTADWSAVLDGILFIEEMTAPTLEPWPQAGATGRR